MSFGFSPSIAHLPLVQLFLFSVPLISHSSPLLCTQIQYLVAVRTHLRILQLCTHPTQQPLNVLRLRLRIGIFDPNRPMRRLDFDLIGERQESLEGTRDGELYRSVGGTCCQRNGAAPSRVC